jgi:hypothetical protein
MFVRDFIHVDRPFEVIAPRFLGHDLPMESLAFAAISEACASLSTVDPEVVTDGLRFTRGPLRPRGEAIVVPVRCVNERHRAGPASIDGELEVAPLGARTELGFEASYRRSTDDPELVSDMRRITELAVRTFLHALGRVLER